MTIEQQNQIAFQSNLDGLETMRDPSDERHETIGECLALAMRLYFMGEPFPNVQQALTCDGITPTLERAEKLRAELVETIENVES